MTKLYLAALSAEGATGIVTEGMKTAFSTALQSVQTSVVDMITTALPIGLGIMGLFLAIKLALKFFRSIAN